MIRCGKLCCATFAESLLGASDGGVPLLSPPPPPSPPPAAPGFVVASHVQPNMIGDSGQTKSITSSSTTTSAGGTSKVTSSPSVSEEEKQGGESDSYSYDEGEEGGEAKKCRATESVVRVARRPSGLATRSNMKGEAAARTALVTS